MEFYSHIWNSGTIMKAEDRHFLPGVLDLVVNLFDQPRGPIPGMAHFTYSLSKSVGAALLSVYRLGVPIWTAGFYLNQDGAGLLLLALGSMADGIGDEPCRCGRLKSPGMITLVHRTSSIARITQKDAAMLTDFGKVMCAAWLKGRHKSV